MLVKVVLTNVHGHLKGSDQLRVPQTAGVICVDLSREANGSCAICSCGIHSISFFLREGLLLNTLKSWLLL